MTVDLSVSGQLGYAALEDIRSALAAAQHSALKAGQIANQSLSISKKAETLIAELAKLQPSAAGDKVLRWLDANKTRTFELIKDPHKAFAEFKQTGIELQDFGGGSVNVIDMHTPALQRGLDLHFMNSVSLPQKTNHSVTDFL